jgi:hypothetical protein
LFGDCGGTDRGKRIAGIAGKQARLVLKGHANSEHSHADAMPIVQEYFTRRALAELGYTTSTDKLPGWKADAFAAIALEIQDFKNKQMAKSSKFKK